MSKKETIVPGVHDLVPPQGLVTVEVLDGRGRVRKRQRAENSIMNWLLANVPLNGGRGPQSAYGIAQGASYSSQFNPLLSAEKLGNLTPPTSAEAAVAQYGWTQTWGPIRQQNWVWATDSDANPDPGSTCIPVTDDNGEVTGGFKLDRAWTADGVQNKRGALVPGLSGWTLDQVRMVGEFGPGIGTGVYRSIGLGMLIPQPIAPGGLRAGIGLSIATFSVGTENYNLTSVAFGFNVIAYRGCYDRVSEQIMMCDSGNNLDVLDASDLGRAQATLSLLVSSGNLPGAAGQFGVVALVPDDQFWVSKVDTLYRCDRPTSDVAMTVNNTYDLSATLGAETIHDLTTDFTSVFVLTDTKLIEIDPADGSVLGNVAHGVSLNGTGNVEYDSQNDLFWIACGQPDAGTDGGWGWDGSVAGQFSWSDENQIVLRGITKVGADTGKRIMLPQSSSQTDQQNYLSTIMAMTPNGMDFGFTKQQDAGGYQHRTMPQCGSHAVLDADVDKEALDGLRITYDFNFDPPA